MKLNLKFQIFYANSQQNEGPFTFCKICHKRILFNRYFPISQISNTSVYISR